MADLKNNINQMIAESSLRRPTEEYRAGLAQDESGPLYPQMLQGQRDLETVSRQILSELAPLVSAQHGVFYVVDNDDKPLLKLLSSFAYRERKHLSNPLPLLGEGLIGQAALEKESLLITDAPPDYIKIGSGPGEGSLVNIIVLLVLYEGQVKAVIELASFGRFSDIHQAFFDQLTESIGIELNTIEATIGRRNCSSSRRPSPRSCRAARQSSLRPTRGWNSRPAPLQASRNGSNSRQEEPQATNEELEEKARLLSVQNQEVEHKNKEIEQARQALEEKAEQLALTSSDKS